MSSWKMIPFSELMLLILFDDINMKIPFALNICCYELMLVLWTQVHVSVVTCELILLTAIHVHLSLHFANKFILHWNMLQSQSTFTSKDHAQTKVATKAQALRASHNVEYFSINNSPNKAKTTMHLLKQLKLLFSFKSICSFSSISLIEFILLLF